MASSKLPRTYFRAPYNAPSAISTKVSRLLSHINTNFEECEEAMLFWDTYAHEESMTNDIKISWGDTIMESADEDMKEGLLLKLAEKYDICIVQMEFV